MSRLNVTFLSDYDFDLIAFSQGQTIDVEEGVARSLSIGNVVKINGPAIGKPIVFGAAGTYLTPAQFASGAVGSVGATATGSLVLPSGLISTGVGTDLSYTPAADSGVMVSNSGLDATIPAATTTDAGLFLPGEKVKLSNIAEFATANDTNAQLRDRSTHTGQQPASTISDFNTAVDARVPVASAIAPQPNAQTATIGTATTYARADHAHKEALTVLGYDAATKTLTYKDEAGITTSLDLSALAVDLRVDGASISGNTLTLTVNDSGTATDVVVDLSTLKTVNVGGSITGDGNTSTLQLSGDAATPGNSRYYGTDGAGAKGFHALPSVPPTNLGVSPAISTVSVTSSTGTGINLPAATTTLAGVMSSTDKTKLDGIATAATANSTDAVLLARANHTGTQTTATISDFTTAVDARIGAASIDALADVTVTAPTVGQVLKWSGTTWVNDTDLSGGGRWRHQRHEPELHRLAY